VESFRSVREAIGPIERGMSLFAITRGQWSMIDAVRYCVAELGRADVSVWTWTIAEYEIEVMEGLLVDKGIGGARLVIDYSADRRNSLYIDRWRGRFGSRSVRICRNHAKVCRVWNDEYKLLLRGSMKLNHNPRFEQFDLSEGGKAFALVTEIEDALPVLPRKYSNHEVESATGLNRAWEAKQLAMFAGVKVWKK
jgi:hypothetical protein